MNTQILIRATNASPEITVADLRDNINTLSDVAHWREVIDDCATQVGRDACQRAYAMLNQIESDLA